MNSRRVNMRDVAREAGVSLATVSLAMRGHPSIPVATRERILAVAERMGYRANARVAELMGEIRRNRAADRITESAALVWSDATREAVGGFGHLVEMEGAVRERLGRHGFGLDVFYREDESMKHVERVLRARGIRGVILAPLIRLPHRHLNWDWSRLSVVIAGSGLWRPEFHRVRFNHFEEMALILHHLRHRGKSRKVALISDKAVDARSQRAVVGGFLAHAGEGAEACVFESNGNDRVALLKWLRAFRPDHIVVGRADVIDWLLESGMESKLVLTSQYLHSDGERYAGIREDYGRLGSASAGQLLQQLTFHESGEPQDPIKIFITGRWEGAGEVGEGRE